jgi:hypothetical protein
VESPGTSVVVVVLVLVVVVLLVVDVDVDVVVVDVVGGPGAHVGVPVGSGGSPLSIAHVTVTAPPGVYCTITRSLLGTPRLLGPSRCGRSNRFMMRRSSCSTGFGAVVVVVESGGADVGGTVGAVVGLLVGGVVGAAVVGGEVGGVDGGGGETVTTVGASTVDVVGAGRVVDTVVDVGCVVTVVEVASDVLVDGGCVGTATLLSASSVPPSATNATSPMAHNAITAPAVMRAAVTSWVPLRVPCERRIESAARAESTSATIVPRIGRTMLTTAHTIAAIAKGSTLGLPPHPPGP